MRGARLVPLFLDCLAKKGHTEIVKALLAGGANVNAADKDGGTPLYGSALSTRARGSLQCSAAPHAHRCSARAAREAEH